MLSKRYLDMMEGVFMLAAIDSFGGKRKAADALGTSIDTINKYIDTLEAEMGCKLIYSDDKGSKLTLDGKKALRVSGDHFQQDVDNIQRLSLRQRQFKGVVRVAMNYRVRANMPFRKVGDFLSKYPDISIALNCIDKNSDIIGHTFDVAVCSDCLYHENWELICHKKSAAGFFASAKYLSRRGYPKDMDDLLENHNVLIRENHHDSRDSKQEALRQAKHVVYSANAAFDIHDAIWNGLGIGVMPLCFAGEGIVCLDNLKCDEELYFYLLANIKTKEQPQNQMVIDLFRKILEEM